MTEPVTADRRLLFIARPPGGGRAPPVRIGLPALLLAFLMSLASTRAQPTLPPLATVSGSPRLPGKFVWADLVTDDVPRARAFYGAMFGWTFQIAGNYTIASNGE